MELGLTIPFQRFLKRGAPACGLLQDRHFCWDLHVIPLRGRMCLLAVHCRSRYTFVCWDPPPSQWADLPSLFRDGLLDSLRSAGFGEERISRYFQRAGPPVLTRTHGRREVAFLNRAWEDVLALDLCLDTAGRAQPLLERGGQHPSQPVCGFRGPGDRAGADGRVPGIVGESLRCGLSQSGPTPAPARIRQSSSIGKRISAPAGGKSPEAGKAPIILSCRRERSSPLWPAPRRSPPRPSCAPDGSAGGRSCPD